MKQRKQLHRKDARDCSIWPVVTINHTIILELSTGEFRDAALIQGQTGLDDVEEGAADCRTEQLNPKKFAKLAKGGAVNGAAGVILGIGRQRGLQCAGLLGATTGVYPDLEAARAVIQMLTGLVGMPVELKDLDTEIEDMRKKMEKFRRTELEEVKEGEEKTEEGKDRYIT